MWPFKKKQQDSDVPVETGPLRLTCPHCGQLFVVGQDSVIVTDEDVAKTFMELGGRGMVTFGAPRKPDLVMHAGRALTDEESKKQLAKLPQIRAAIRQGLPRSWKCDRCRHEPASNSYPGQTGKA